MIVSKDINPRRELYYLGAIVLHIMSSSGNPKVDFFELFHKLNDTEHVSIRLFSLTLNWLFLLGKINSEEGDVELCS